MPNENWMNYKMVHEVFLEVEPSDSGACEQPGLKGLPMGKPGVVFLGNNQYVESVSILSLTSNVGVRQSSTIVEGD